MKMIEKIYIKILKFNKDNSPNCYLNEVKI